MIAARIQRLRPDQRGVTVVEFALIAPVLCLLLIGGLEIAHTLYVRATLHGALQKASRDATMESGTIDAVTTKIDEKVAAQVRPVAGESTFTFKRRFYRTFTEAAAARAEDFDDTNKDGTCNAGEPFEDINHNDIWDKDGGNTGQGGAKDATIYTVTVKFSRIMGITGILGGGRSITLQASTVLRNQPYGDQGSYGAPGEGNCT